MVQMPSSTLTSIDISCAPLPAEQVAGDHHAMYLGRTFADALDAQFAVPAFQRHFPGDAEAAENLDAAIHHAARGFGGVDFADRGIDLDVEAEVAAPGRLVDQQPRRPQFDF